MVLVMIIASFYFDEWIENFSILPLTYVGFILLFFSSTQDIAADGWFFIYS